MKKNTINAISIKKALSKLKEKQRSSAAYNCLSRELSNSQNDLLLEIIEAN